MKTKNLLKTLALGAIGVVALVGCEDSKSPEEVLKSLILTEDNKVVSEDFAVPTKVQGCDVTWTTSDAAVTIADKDDNFKYAAITRPEEGSKEVTLTATLKSGKKTAKKDFKVTLNAVDVIEVADHYKFAQEGSMLFEDFALDTEYTYSLYNVLSDTAYRNCTAEMSWSSSNEDLISISEDGKTAFVNPQDEKALVTLTCTFTFNGRSSEYEYKVSVFKEMSPADQLMRFYDHAGEGDAYDINGYVLWKTEYNPTYGNCYLYMVDETYTGGIYIYRVYTSQTIYDQLQLGSGITCTGITSTNYNGLIETNEGGDITLNNDLPAFDLSKATTAIDELLFMTNATGPSNLLYKQSTFVTLTGWKVDSVGQAFESTGSGTQTLLTLKKNNVSIKICISKYVTPFAESLAPEVATIQSTYKVGDIVNVKGILGYYNGYQILATGADSVSKAESESTVTVPAIYGAFDTISKVELPETVVTETQLQLPTISTEGVTLTWSVTGSTASLEGNVVTINPINKPKNVVVTATLTDGKYTFAYDFEIFTQALDAAGQVEEALKGLSFEDVINSSKSVNLPATDATFTNVSYTYALNAEAVNAKLESGKLVFTQSGQEETVVLTVTATYGEATNTRTFEIIIEAKLDVTIAKAIEIAVARNHNDYSPEKYIISGVVKEVQNTQYGNMVITDGKNDILLYGTYDAEGNRYDAMAKKPVVGDVVTVQEGLGNYNGTPQMKNAVVIAHHSSQVGLEEAASIGGAQGHNTYTTETYVIKGTVKSIANTQYGNIYITDGTNEFYIYGIYDVFGKRYDAMAAQPAVGDQVVLYSTLGQYNGTAQAKNATLVSIATSTGGDDPVTPPTLIGPSISDEAGKVWMTVDNWATAKDQFTLVNTDLNASYPNEFTLGKNGSSIAAQADSISKVVIFVQGTYLNQKLFAGKDATGTEIVATSENKTEGAMSGVVYTYTLPEGTKAFYLENTATYNVNLFSIEVYCTGTLVPLTSDETGGDQGGNGGGETPAPTTQKLTIAEALTLGAAQAHDTYTSELYEVTGTIKEITNTKYGNMYITDGTNEILIYGLYAADGTTGFADMTDKPFIGDVITVHSVVGQYSNSPQLKNAKLIANEAKVWTDAEKVAYDKENTKISFSSKYVAAATLDLVVEGVQFTSTIAWAVTAGTTATISEGKLVLAPTETEDTVTLTATFTNGEATDTATYTFKTQLPGAGAVVADETLAIIASTGSLVDKVITWTGTNVTFQQAQKSSTSPIRVTDTDHFRAYASSETTISGNAGALISKVVITVTDSKYVTILQTSLTNAGYTSTASGNDITVELATPASSIVFTASAQWRLNKVVVTYMI